MIQRLLSKKEKRYSRLISLSGGVLFAGFLIGVIACTGLNPANRSALFEAVQDFLRRFSLSAAGGGQFWPCFWKEETYILLFLLLGSWAAGLPFIMALLFIRGFSLGFAGSLMLQSAPGLHGFFLAFLGLFPHNFFALPLWAVLGGHSASRSFRLLSSKRDAAYPDLGRHFSGEQLKKALLFFLGGAGVAWIEGFLSPALLSFLS